MSQGEGVIILLIEDDPAHAETVQRAFLYSGMKAVVHWTQNLGDYQALAAADICRNFHFCGVVKSRS